MTTALASRIETVTVFTRGAAVTRVADLTPESGHFPDRVRLAGLPLALDDASVRVRVEAEHGVAPLATDVAITLEAPTTAAITAPDDEALEAARVAVERAEALVRRLNAKKKRFEKVQVASRPTPEPGHAPIATPRAARFALVELRERVLAEIDAQRFAAEDALEAARDHLTTLEDRLQRASTARTPRAHELRKTVVLTLTGRATAASARVYVEYRVPGARWAPSYVLRLDRTLTAAELAVSALVRQSTGEDWSKVRLRLSTAAWQQWVELPKLESLRVGRAQPRRAPAWRPAPVGAGALFADYDRAFAGPRTEPPCEMEPEIEDDFDADDTGVDHLVQRAGRPNLAMRALDEFPAQMSIPGGALSADSAIFAAPAACLEESEAMMPRASRSIASLGFGGGSPAKKRVAPAPRRPAIEPEVVLARRLLEYGNLYLAGSDDARRGELVHEDRFARYRRVLAFEHFHVQLDVVHAIGIAERDAQAGELSAPAPRHVFAEASDGFDYAYDALGENDVPSNGQDYRVPLALNRARAAAKYVVVPRVSRDVFREVHLENPLAAPLLAGPVDVYVDDAFLSTVDLATCAPRGEVRIGLGVEQAIKVSRNARFAEHSAGLIRGSRDLVHSVRIDLTNHLPRAATLEVRERLPVVEERDDDVKVTIDRVTPHWTAHEPKDALLKGGHQWTVEVAPGGERTLELDYTIRIKAGEELVGGNNREI